MKRVLLITDSQDHHCTDRVDRALRQRDAAPGRLDTDLFPEHYRMTIRPQGALDLSGDHLTSGWIDEVTALWWRRESWGARCLLDVPSSIRHASIEETKRIIRPRLAEISGIQINPTATSARARDKCLQLRVAEMVGLPTPETIITNDADEARAFAECWSDDIIVKMMGSYVIAREGRYSTVFTTRVGRETVLDFAGIELCPVLLQRHVAKRRDIRAIVVGGRVFAAALDVEPGSRHSVDWRREGLRLSGSWRRVALGDEIDAALRRLCVIMNTPYSAIDLIQDESGKVLFLEANPEGEYFWIEDSAGLPISDALADALCGCD